MRHLEKQDALIQLSQQDGIDLEVKQLDVTNLNHINQAVTDIINTEGRIDILFHYFVPSFNVALIKNDSSNNVRK